MLLHYYKERPAALFATGRFGLSLLFLVPAFPAETLVDKTNLRSWCATLLHPLLTMMELY
jgi:hypothetical protein